MRIMVRRVADGLSVYVPKKDLEEDVVESESEAVWGGWVKLRNGLVLGLPEMPEGVTLPVTVNARLIGSGAD